MGKPNEKAKRTNPELTQLLGTDDPALQMERVRRIIQQAVIEREIAVTIFFQPNTGHARITTSADTTLRELDLALDAGRQHVIERQVQARLEQQNASQNPTPPDHRHPSDPGEPTVRTGGDDPAPTDGQRQT